MNKIFEAAKRIRSLATIGLYYSANEYDTERYDELQELAEIILVETTSCSLSEIKVNFIAEKDYITPKTDIRAVVFNDEGEILLVQEKLDGKWSLPGGWADIGFSPSEVAVKEVLEETGLNVKPVRLLAVHDKKCHNHPPALHYVYKIFIECVITGGIFNECFDILGKGFFPRNNIPSLSKERVTEEQILLMFDYFDSPSKEVSFD